MSPERLGEGVGTEKEREGKEDLTKRKKRKSLEVVSNRQTEKGAEKQNI